MNNIKSLLLLFSLLCGVVSSGIAQSRPEGVSIGVNYPGVGLKYNWGKNNVEIRGQFLSDTDLVGGRYNRFFHIGRSDSFLYLGGEASYFSYEDKDKKFETDGYLTGLYVGLEKFLTKRISVNLDLGPYYAHSNNPNIGNESEGVFDFVLNVSIDYSFRGMKK